MGTQKQDLEVNSKSITTRKNVGNTFKAFPENSSQNSSKNIPVSSMSNKSTDTNKETEIQGSALSTYDETQEANTKVDDKHQNISASEENLLRIKEQKEQSIPPISNIIPSSNEINKDNEKSTKSDTNIRFKPIVDPGNFNSTSPKSREVYQKNGLRTVFLPFKIQQSPLQNQFQAQNIPLPYLPPPVRQMNTPVPYSSQITFNSQNLSQVPLITPQASLSTQPQVQTQMLGLLNPQKYQQQATNAHMIPSSNLSVATPPINHHSRTLNIPQTESIESIQVNHTLGQPISDEQLEARSNGMASFRLKSDPKRQLSSKTKPYKCSFPGCEWSFARQSDLRRHSKSHGAPQYYCPYWRKDQTCHKNGGAFNRLDVLKRHLRLVHYIPDFNAGSVKSKNDSGWCKACQKMFANSKMFIEHCAICASNVVATKWSEVRTDEYPSQQSELQFMKSLASNQPDELFKDSSELYDPNSNLITLSTVINEFENQAKRKDL